MENEITILNRDNSQQVSVVMLDDDIWVNQKMIGRLLSMSKQNVSLHIKELQYCNVCESKTFSIAQKEGNRVIKRHVTCYSMSVVTSIANMSRRVDLLKPLFDLANKKSVTIKDTFVPVRKELQFHKMLSGILEGIVTVKTQYKINGDILDFYIPELNIGIEYDERAHERPKQKKADNARQLRLQQNGLKIIRIKQGEETQGLNNIIKALHAC